MSRLIVDCFGGPGGWAEGLRSLGLSEVGIEIDPWACATRAAAGHPTIRADVAACPIAPFGGAWGLIFSPPCQDWSRAGKGAGRAGETGHLVDQVPRWVGDIRPEWVACEQVPDVLPVWREFAYQFEVWGYSTWCGILNAADYGVPQCRPRAIFIASQARAVTPPAATHAEHPHPVMFGDELLPWVTMAEALGCLANTVLSTGTNSEQAHGYVAYERSAEAARSWQLNPGRTASQPNRRTYDPGTEPAPTIAFGHDMASWCWERPATTVCADNRIAPPGHRDRAGGERQFTVGTVKVTEAEALTLQSMPADYPVKGNKHQRALQIGNLIPPRLAAHVVAAAAGIERHALEATA